MYWELLMGAGLLALLYIFMVALAYASAPLSASFAAVLRHPSAAFRYRRLREERLRVGKRLSRCINECTLFHMVLGISWEECRDQCKERYASRYWELDSEISRLEKLLGCGEG